MLLLAVFLVLLRRFTEAPDITALTVQRHDHCAALWRRDEQGRLISFYGDNHPTYAGNVVKAMASALAAAARASSLGRAGTVR